MDIHIVWNPDKGDVLSRLYTSLARGTGWTIGKQIRKDADLNYFGLYVQIAQSPQSLKGLKKTAAMFSHFEAEVPQKADWWNQSVGLVDIRTTWAEQYLEMLKPHGESHIVIPPIDSQFKRVQKAPVIGVSGYVPKGGRKGESLVKRLVAEHPDWEIIASGKGWPVKSENIQERRWDEMPAFYESLDVYLVTSLTEGIPMPPLEALAMGIPVVVPRNVGLLSDKLYGNKVYFYEAGNYDLMLAALRKALGELSNPIKDFTEDAWCESHRVAFGLNAGAEIKSPATGGYIEAGVPYLISEAEGAVDFVPIPAPITPYIPNSGAIVVAYGAPARECAKTALASWKRFMPAYSIALVSDEPLGIEDVFIHAEDSDIGARSVKTRLYDLAPADWENVLYLDADTEVTAHIGVLFQWLADGWDFLICTNPGLYASITQGARPDNKEELEVTIEEIGSGEIIQWNGGVFAFRRGDAGAALMRGWHSEWLRYKGRDQFALLRALHKNPVKMLSLGGEWNTITRFLDPAITAGILHHPLRARRWAGIIFGPLDSKEAWGRVIK